MDESGWVQGDGGPLIVLQASAASQWQGAMDFDNSLMNGGSIETDYDVICQCMAEVCLLRRYERDILVLSDSEWSGRMVALPSGQIRVVQSFYRADELPEITERADQTESSRSFAMTVDDGTLRLLVGADDGGGGMYGKMDVPVRPGIKQCEVHVFEDGVVVTISACGEQTHDE